MFKNAATVVKRNPPRRAVQVGLPRLLPFWRASMVGGTGSDNSGGNIRCNTIRERCREAFDAGQIKLLARPKTRPRRAIEPLSDLHSVPLPVLRSCSGMAGKAEPQVLAVGGQVWAWVS